jgi:hypothetical protein
MVAILWSSLIASCDEGSSMGAGGGGSGGSGGSAVARQAGSGGGFSAALAKEFALGPGSGSAKAGSAEPKAGSAEPVAKAGSAEPVAKAGSAEPAPQGPPDPGPIVQGAGTPPTKVTVPADLAAIKFGMLPNWERDVQAAGTLSLAVKIPGRGDSAVFVFRYGYEAADAPKERDKYKAWLAEKRLLTVRQDRQASGAWILEGNDDRGNPAFRVVVNWGERKLICYGSLYRDAASNRLGDLRDQTVLQAKQICETVAL